MSDSRLIRALKSYFFTAEFYVPNEFIDGLSEPADAISIFIAFFGFDYDSARNLMDSLQAQYDTPSQSGALEAGVDDDDDDLPGDFTYPASTAE